MKTRHLVLLLIGCILPIIALGAFVLLHLSTSILVLVLILLLCPLVHLFMMKSMHHAPNESLSPQQGEHSVSSAIDN